VAGFLARASHRTRADRRVRFDLVQLDDERSSCV
jgi:hypothetical protein